MKKTCVNALSETFLTATVKTAMTKMIDNELCCIALIVSVTKKNIFKYLQSFSKISVGFNYLKLF